MIRSILGIPSFESLKVIEILRLNEEYYDSYVRDTNLPKDFREEYIPSRTIISVLSKSGRADITINSDNGEIFVSDWEKLIPKDNLSFTSLILLFPIFFITNGFWILFEEMIGMEKHAWSVWLRIKNQLDPLTYLLAEKAFLKYKK